jgi:anti-sigma factor RsiW
MQGEVNLIDEATLQAYVDDRLDAAARARVEAALARRPEDAARVAHYRAQNAAMHALYDPVMDEAHALRVPAVAPGWRALLRGRLPAPFDPRWALAATLVLGIGLGTALGYGLHAVSDQAAPRGTPLARAAALAHVAYMPEVRHPVEVTAQEEQHLLAWLSKRLAAPLKAPALGAAGYRLLGGRLLPASGELGDAPVALLIYENATGKRLSLMVRRAANSRETAFQFSRQGKTGVFYWIDGPFGYALAGDVERDELSQVAQLVYRQLNP